jgi:hypothetical protein
MNSVTRKSIIGALIAVAVLASAELAAQAAESSLPQPDSWPSPETAAKVDQMQEIVEETEPITTVFLGSSVVAEGVDPGTFSAVSNTTAYNAALSAASPRSLAVWAEDLVIPLTQPRVAILGLISRDLNENGISQIEFFERVTSAPAMIDLGKPDNPMEVAEKWLLDHFALFRLRPLLRDPGMLMIRLLGDDPPTDDDVIVGPLGADTSSGDQPYSDLARWRAAWTSRHLNDFSIGDTETEALRSLLQSLESAGTEVWLVNMPVTEDYLATVPDGRRRQSEFSDLLQNVAAELDISFIDVSEAYEKSRFRDPAHLTSEAARDLAALLAAQVDMTSG